MGANRGEYPEVWLTMDSQILGTNLIMQLFVRIVKPILTVLVLLTMEASSVMELIEGRAEFVDAHTVSVNGELTHAKHIVIATGAHPHIPAVPGAELGGSSDDVIMALGDSMSHVRSIKT